jgi:hypothetical protein
MIRKEPRWRFADDNFARRDGEFKVVLGPSRPRFDALSFVGLATLIVSGSIVVAELFPYAGTAGELRRLILASDRSYQTTVDLLSSVSERIVDALD